MTAETADEGTTRARRHTKIVVNTAASPTKRALMDLWTGLLQFNLWGLLGWADVRNQYRRSTLGPLWITLSTGIFVATLGLLYAGLFDRALEHYVPHLAIGYIIWGMIATFIESGAKCFISAERIIKQLAAPLSVHVYRLMWSTLLTVAHHAIIFVIVAMVFQITPTMQWLLVIPGFLLIFATGMWVILFLGMLSARFRDVPQIVQSAVRVLFFLTPVIWMPETNAERAAFLTVNPFYHYIELVRAPLLNQPIDPLHWQVAGAITLVGWIFTLIVYRRFRPRVAYWL